MKPLDKSRFTISQEDWSLHRKGYDDQQRHKEKVKEAIKKNLPDLITEESIILSNGKDVIKIPIRSLDEYKIRYNYDKNKHVGQGNGKSKVGDVVAKDGEAGQGKGQGAGDQPGEDYYEAEVFMSLPTILQNNTNILRGLLYPNSAENGICPVRD